MRIIATILVLALLAGCTAAPPGPNEPPSEPRDEPAEGLQKFESLTALEQYLAEQGPQRGGYARGFAMDGVAEAAMPTTTNAAASAKGGAEEYSQTNVQVQGVDEADYVKNDGEFIYVLSGDELVIAKAYPPEEADIISETSIPGRPQSLFLSGDRLLVLTQEYGERFFLGTYDFMPRPRSTQRTTALLYDVSSEEPELLKNWSVTGNLFEARLVENQAYVVTQQRVSYGDVEPPILYEDGEHTMPEIYHFSHPSESYVFTTVTALNLDEEEANAETFLMGYGATLYATSEHIYIAYQKQYQWDYHEREQRRFFEAVVPLLPRSVQRDIEEARDELDDGEEWLRIADVLRDYYEGLDEEELEELYDEIRFAVEEWETKENLERSKTVIQKLAIDDGSIDYEGSGEVRGSLLNQWSMDEHDGHLRVATTLSYWDSIERDRVQFNNVYVLDEEMGLVGELEQLAEDERIYAARFMGERLYLVTFKQIDPFFVIDLSEPRSPKVLGELKLPGYSSYLHPYDEEHIIGIGKEGDESGRLGGVKVALFDVSDVSEPEVLDSVEVGGRGSTSAVLNDHKAFLFDKERGLLVIPIRETGEREYDEERGYYRRESWQGAYAFDIDTSGIEERGRVTHREGDERDYYSRYEQEVRRIITMDDVLYTLSRTRIKMNDLDSLDELNELELPYEEEPRYGYPTPMPIVR